MPFRLRWKSDLEKNVITQNFEHRGWQRHSTESDFDDACAGTGIASGIPYNSGLTQTTNQNDWNIYWASVGSVRSIFSAESGIRLSDMQ